MPKIQNRERIECGQKFKSSRKAAINTNSLKHKDSSLPIILALSELTPLPTWRHE